MIVVNTVLLSAAQTEQSSGDFDFIDQVGDFATSLIEDMKNKFSPSPISNPSAAQSPSNHSEQIRSSSPSGQQDSMQESMMQFSQKASSSEAWKWIAAHKSTIIPLLITFGLGVAAMLAGELIKALLIGAFIVGLLFVSYRFYTNYKKQKQSNAQAQQKD